MDGNLLHLETSPYLLQHRDNPVHWRAWGAKALAAAKAMDKPILLSVGYAACHWCHVMAHESFEDDATAGLMNRLFVNIKVDREERPDIDAIYQAALAMLGQQGGWPLTMFLTPSGAPFWGGTYFPRSTGFGRPAFGQVLQRVDEIYRTRREAVEGNRVAIVKALAERAAAPREGTLSLAAIDKAAEQVQPHVDTDHGGIGGAPKFPQTPLLGMLWRYGQRHKRADFSDSLHLSLEKMCAGGIYDHLGGGFSRYSVDERWLVPHFEKMLYDNALMIDALTLAWQQKGAPLYAERVAETVGWLLREMIAEGGAFAASLDADSEGEEGRFYVWSKAEVDTLLGDEAAFFAAHYDVTAGGNWEGKTILNRSRDDAPPDSAGEARLAAARSVLLEARGGRVRPGWDDKALADWNGLTIAALANAAAVFGQPEWLEAARRAYDFILTKMRREEEPEAPDSIVLYHSWRDGKAGAAGMLDDYAALMGAAITLWEVVGDSRYVSDARALFTTLEAHFRDHGNGAYFSTSDDADDLIVRSRGIDDQSTPSGNGLLADALARLYTLTGEDLYRQRAEEIIEALGSDRTDQIIGAATLAGAFETLQNCSHIVILGDRAEAGCRALIDAVFALPLAGRLLSVYPRAVAGDDNHPAHGKTMQNGRATAYVCRGQVCSAPLQDPAALKAALEG